MYKEKEYEDALRNRIKDLMRDKLLTQSTLAKEVGFQPTNLSNILSGKREVPESLVKSILDVYREVDSMWLVHGVGNMYSKDNGPQAKQTKPRLPVSAAAGGLSTYIDGIRLSDCEQMPVIANLPTYDFTMFIRGNSMAPKYESGDEIALKRANIIIEWGKDYVLDTADGAIFKKIYDDGDNIRCVSYNKEEYPDIIVPKSAIYGYYKLVGLVRTEL